jgi:hypothetical protein
VEQLEELLIPNRSQNAHLVLTGLSLDGTLVLGDRQGGSTENSCYTRPENFSTKSVEMF